MTDFDFGDFLLNMDYDDMLDALGSPDLFFNAYSDPMDIDPASSPDLSVEGHEKMHVVDALGFTVSPAQSDMDMDDLKPEASIVSQAQTMSDFTTFPTQDYSRYVSRAAAVWSSAPTSSTLLIRDFEEPSDLALSPRERRTSRAAVKNQVIEEAVDNSSHERVMKSKNTNRWGARQHDTDLDSLPIVPLRQIQSNRATRATRSSPGTSVSLTASQTRFVICCMSIFPVPNPARNIPKLLLVAFPDAQNKLCFTSRTVLACYTEAVKDANGKLAKYEALITMSKEETLLANGIGQRKTEELKGWEKLVGACGM